MKEVPAQRKKEFRERLMQWNGQNRRDLPWKGEKDPYKIWLSEIILQQTRVEQGAPYYERFIRRYPSISALAEAEEREAFRLWQGLGYYNRCRNMLAAARRVAGEKEGVFPDTYEDILALPGVGAYTAAAIASFAYNLPYAVVDGNVQRVLARWFGIRIAPASTEGRKVFAALAAQTLDTIRPAVYNQAIMDFGATVCTPAQPHCDSCLLREGCVARTKGLTDVLPVKTPKAKPRERHFHYLVLCRDQHVFVRKRGAGDIWQNLHEFLLHEGPLTEAPPDFTAFLREDQLPRRSEWSPTYTQQLTHQRIHARFLRVQLHQPPSGGEAAAFFPAPAASLDDYAFPRLIVRYLQDGGLLK
jgi:A/G-specific adenine glycosylase